MAPLVVIIFNFVLKNVGPSDGFARTLVVAAVSLLLYIGGLALAIYALFQVRTVGKPGVLAPALVGLLLNGLFLALILFVAVASFNAARAHRQGQAVLPPSAAAVSSPPA